MSETPRLRSAFPATPRTDFQGRTSRSSRPEFASSQGSQSKPSPRTRPVHNTSSSQARKDGPLVSLDIIDAPTQRFYVAAFYIGLLAWRLYNSWNVTDDLDSTWLFLKWLGLDAAFFVALPAFRIPWLEWSFATTITMWLLHAIANAFLMYKIPIPILGWLGAVVKVAYDRELAISEHRVKPADILHNSSVILGKQIIQILPEGSAILNPEKRAFCLDSIRTSTVELPIQINQTTPISIELTRQDIETDEIETIIISGKQAKNLKKEADKGHLKSDTSTPRLLHYQVTKKGVYRLSRVIDESKLEVRKRSYEVAVVACPKASLSADVKDKCTGDLSGISLHVEGVPPFKVKYSKRINQHRATSVTQNLQPSDFDQNKADDGSSNVVLDPKNPHKGLTQSRSVSVQINESLTQNGTWSYHVEEVEDGLGNKAMFDTDKVKKISEAHEQSLIVHRRPIVHISSRGSQQPLKIPEGEKINLPVQIESAGQIPEHDWPLVLKYTFTPDADMASTSAEERVYELANEKATPKIGEAGRYDLKMIESQFCQGEVQEPSSCLLYNPPKPDIAVGHESLFDKCAGNPVGMIVSMDFTGTPPFKIRYTKTHQGVTHSTSKVFNSMRGHLELIEDLAGSYVYQILDIQDDVYATIPLKTRNLVFTQDIKPSASATFQNKHSQIKVCLGEPVQVPVKLQGEGPWDLDYEVLHGGKRKKHSIHSELETLEINLPELNEGGRHTVMLTGVQDRSKCRTALAEEYHIEVRAERPMAAFGDVSGQRTIKTLEGNPVEIPVRLQGVGPWTVRTQNINHDSQPRTQVLQKRNSVIVERQAGTYELLSVHDSCSGIVDTKANKFSIEWIERPALSIKDSGVVSDGPRSWRKAPVCQGYEDNLNLALSGNPPYRLRYTQRSEPVNEKPAVGDKRFSVASSNAMIKLETSKAGEYTYTFTELADGRYDYSKKHFDTTVVKQQVYALPSARFTNSGKTYGYCKDDPALSSDSDTEKIPISLTGSPPFSIEVSIAHHGSTQRPEIKRINEISSNTFLWSLARSTFDLGTHTLQIRSVKDSHGCESIIDNSPSTVRIQVSAPPTINSLESTTDYCVGDHVSFSLSGQAPFDVFYTFQGRERKAHVTSHEFRRIAEQPGDMVITGVSDAAMGGGGKCRASKNIPKVIHPYPSVRIERGETKVDDIHEGGEVDIHFEFTGTPPFEFTYTRSENLYSYKKSKSKSRKPQILETRHDTSTEFHKTIRASEEGTYEVVAIKDRYCAYSVATGAGKGNRGGIGSQKLLKE